MNILVKSLVTLILSATLVCGREKFPCNHYSGECRTRMEKDGLNPPTLEVSCHCKYRRDVSKNLTTLAPIKCPLVPESEDDVKLGHASLRIENCDIEEDLFPLEILRVLRRSKKLTISVKKAKTLRLESDTLKENGTEPVIEAKFEDSNLNGIGVGWFSGAKDLSLKFENCRIGIIEPEFIGGFKHNATVDVEFENTNITTIKGFAFLFPKHGSLSIEGGTIDQLESDAIDGGENILFDAVIIKSIQNSAINLYGLASFTLEASIVAKLSKNSIIEDNNKGILGAKINSEYHVGEVVIRRNKFIDVDGQAFSGLCRERFLTFQDNFFYNVSSTLALKATHCSIERDWWTAIRNNGFACNKCQNIFGTMNEQVCSLYESGWCLCDSKVHKSAWKTIRDDEDDEDDNSPCRYLVKDYIHSHCSGVHAASKYTSYCKKYSEKAPSMQGASTWVQDSGAQIHSLSLSIVIILLAIEVLFTM